MKALNEYLSAKAKISKSNFEKFETKEEVCNFFENKGFEYYDHNEYCNAIVTMLHFSSSKNPMYCTGTFDSDKTNWWVEFGKGGKDEYIFFWRLVDEIKLDYSPNYLVKDYNDKIIAKFDTFEEFRDYTIKYFGWQ